MESKGEFLVQPPGNFRFPTLIVVVNFPEIPFVRFVTVRRDDSVERVGSSLKMLIVCGLKRQTGPQLISRKESLTWVSFKDMVRNKGHPEKSGLLFCCYEKFYLPEKTSLSMRNKMKVLGRWCVCVMTR